VVSLATEDALTAQRSAVHTGNNAFCEPVLSRGRAVTCVGELHAFEKAGPRHTFENRKAGRRGSDGGGS
jgi:hypothetical protein